MFKRQRYQFGSLSLKRRQKGPRTWEYRYYDAAGKRKTVTVGSVESYPTKAAAERAVEGLRLRINSDAPRTTISVPTFGAVLDRYIAEELPERYSTRVAYLSRIKLHLRPKWGHLPLSQVKPSAVESWLRELELAPKTKTHLKSLMHAVFECAQRWELLEVSRNPIDLVRVKGGSKRQNKPRILTVPESTALLGHLSEPYRTMVVVAQCLGLRISEIVGLQWGDIDFEGRTALVQRGVVHGRVAEVKTEYSQDRVPLDPQLVRVLLDHRALCSANGESDWVFANPKTGKPYHQEQIQKVHLRRAAASVGISGPVGWHTFRHTYRTLLDETGAPMKVQQELMRHASIQTTMNVYGQAMLDSKREANSKVVKLVLSGQTSEGADSAIRSLQSV